MERKVVSMKNEEKASDMSDIRKEQCRFNGKMYDADCLNETIHEAMELALKFKRYCIEHDISCTAEIAGVAWNADWVRETAYLDGKKYEKQRIAGILGLADC